MTKIINFNWKNKYFFTASLNFTSSNCHIKHFYGQKIMLHKNRFFMNELKLPIGSYYCQSIALEWKKNYGDFYLGCDYPKHFATLIERNILKDSNYCFDSLLIRLWSKDLKHLILGNGYPDHRVSIYYKINMLVGITIE